MGRALCALLISFLPALFAGAAERGPVVPGWARDAIVYQILVPRFRNGETDNDMDWTRPWDARWTRMYPGDEPPLYETLFHRRYGGDLQGLIEKLPYLKDLGVNTLYLSPVFQAGSEHKYDTIDYRHIDDSLGFLGSRLELKGETLDPASWQWSRSDRLFLDFLKKAHSMGFRVIADGVFNHVSRKFPQWQDVYEKGRESAYADWFAVTDFGPPIHWKAWDRPDGHLVEFREYGDRFHPEVEAYLFAVVRRWMDPNGDGDPSDGIDGWRLDAAEQVPAGFWRAFRMCVKGVNPDALIVGEIWEDARFWLKGDLFDVVTNYPFSQPVIRYMAQNNSGYTLTSMCEDLDGTLELYPWDVTLGNWNLTGSHDTERCVSMLIDPIRHWDGKGAIPAKDLLVPDADAWARMRLTTLVQFVYPGVPMIYYGNEAGLFGGDDPYSRGPMWWDDVQGECASPDLRGLYRDLIRLRKEHPALSRGDFSIVLADDRAGLWVLERVYEDEVVTVFLNTGRMDVRVSSGAKSKVREASKLVSSSGLLAYDGGVEVPSWGGLILICDKN